MRKKSGFSLIELLVVLALLSIMVVMVAQIGPSVTFQSRFTGAINNFLSDFAAAKQLASMENRYVAIEFADDGSSYRLKKQTNIGSFAAWTDVKTVTPFTDRPFFTIEEVSSFAVNSTGEVRLLKSDDTVDMATGLGAIPLAFYIRKGAGTKTDPLAYRRIIRIFPYGGLKVEK